MLPPDAAEKLRTGIAAYRQSAYAQAAELFTAVLVAVPTHPGARINLANALWAAGDYPAALRHADIARSADPASAEAWIITGAIRLDGKDAGGAVEAYTRAVSLRPQFFSAHAGLAAAFLADGQPAAAEHAACQALAIDPGNEHALFTLASAQLAQHHAQAALELFDSLLAAMPHHARARHNRANALIDLGRLKEAKCELAASLKLDPGLKEAWATLGYLLTIQAELPEAIAACEQAIRLDPDFAGAQWNRGVALLLNGDFAGGFAAYEWRKRHPIFRHHFTPMPGTLWQGENLAGKHLLVRAEQGFGDTIMLARFLPGLAQAAERLTLCCPPCLFPLFRHLNIQLCPLDAFPGMPDYSVDQMSLPHILKVSESTIPLAAGYLSTGAGAVTRPAGEPRIGLVWAGNPGHDNDHHRSLPVGALAPLLALPGLIFVNLQIGARQHEYAVQDSGRIQDYGDTAAILSQLDAVVSVDTSVAHLAGAMAIPCHVLLSKACDWRWRLGRNNTVWYDSVVLHRQEVLDDWSAPIASVVASLQRLFTQTPARPI